MLLLKKERLSKGYSAAQIARMADMHPSTVSQIETGRLVPYLAQQEKLAAVLKWQGNLDDLFREVD